MSEPVITTYLDMLSPEELRPCTRPSVELSVARAEVPLGELNRFFYAEVGRDWGWTDRLPWSLEEWRRYALQEGLETWVGYVRGMPAGYFELQRGPGGDVEIAYFGLMPAFIGQGLGGKLLEAAIRRAWQLTTQRVWVHTCTLDGPYALANYQARGMRVYREE